MVLWTSHFVLYLGPIIYYQGSERQNTIEILIYALYPVFKETQYSTVQLVANFPPNFRPIKVWPKFVKSIAKTNNFVFQAKLNCYKCMCSSNLYQCSSKSQNFQGIYIINILTPHFLSQNLGKKIAETQKICEI